MSPKPFDRYEIARRDPWPTCQYEGCRVTTLSAFFVPYIDWQSGKEYTHLCPEHLEQIRARLTACE